METMASLPRCACWWPGCARHYQDITANAEDGDVWKGKPVKIRLMPPANDEELTIHTEAMYAAILKHFPSDPKRVYQEKHLYIYLHHFPRAMLEFKKMWGIKGFVDRPLSREEVRDIEGMETNFFGGRLGEQVNSIPFLCKSRLLNPAEKARWKGLYVQTPMETEKAVMEFISELQAGKSAPTRWPKRWPTRRMLPQSTQTVTPTKATTALSNTAPISSPADEDAQNAVVVTPEVKGSAANDDTEMRETDEQDATCELFVPDRTMPRVGGPGRQPKVKHQSSSRGTDGNQNSGSETPHPKSGSYLGKTTVCGPTNGSRRRQARKQIAQARGKWRQLQHGQKAQRLKVKGLKDKLSTAMTKKKQGLEEVRKSRESEIDEAVQAVEQTLRSQQEKQMGEQQEELKAEITEEFEKEYEAKLALKRKREEESKRETESNNSSEAPSPPKVLKSAILRRQLEESQAKIDMLTEKKSEMIWLLKQVIMADAKRKMEHLRLKKEEAGGNTWVNREVE